MTTSRITLVVAYTLNRCIGKDNQMPWHLPADLAHFKRVTLGHPIIMGRNTWESIGRPLPGRRNIVITRQADYTADGADVVHSVPEALAACIDAPTVCIIGGAQIYTQALDFANEVIATEIQAHIAGDAFFPPLKPNEWHEVSREPQATQNGLAFDFVVYQKHPKIS